MKSSQSWLQPPRAEWLIELGSTILTSKAILAPCVRASPHLSIGVPVRVQVALPANVIAPHIARASGEAHLQSEEIVERLIDTVMPTILLLVEHRQNGFALEPGARGFFRL